MSPYYISHLFKNRHSQLQSNIEVVISGPLANMHVEVMTISPAVLYAVRRINTAQFKKYKFPRIHENINPNIRHQVFGLKCA